MDKKTLTSPSVLTRDRLQSPAIVIAYSNRFAAVFRIVVVLMTLAAVLFASRAFADVQVGIDGHYRVGQWTAVRIDGEELPNARAVETLDGDGCPVLYDQSKLFASSDSTLGQRFGYVVPGSEAAPLIVLDSDGKKLLGTRFPEFATPASGPSMIPESMPWIVVLGDPMGIEKIGANELLGRDALLGVSVPESAAVLPDHSIGYSGVDLIVITGAGKGLLSQMTTDQANAIVDWVRGGGRMFVSMGSDGVAAVEQSGSIKSLFPFETSTIETVKLDPASLETFVSSQTRLQRFEGVALPLQIGDMDATAVGQHLIMGRTTNRAAIPIASSFNAGLGRVSVIAADLDSGQFADWPERAGLLEQLTGSILVLEASSRETLKRNTTYDDLAGQARLLLDRFPSKPRFSFSLLSVVVLGLIALIGPLDYLVVNRLFGRPLLGWLTFPIVTIGISVVLVMATRPVALEEKQQSSANSVGREMEIGSHSTGIRCNQLEIIDIDAVSGTGRGFSWDFVYSHPARRMNFASAMTTSSQSLVDRFTTKLSTPFGSPGDAFGGIRIAGQDNRFPRYTVSVLANQGSVTSTIDSMPIAPLGSKSLATRYTFTTNIAADMKVEKRERGTSLQGAFTNPLPVDIYDGKLIYGATVYYFPNRLPVGGSLANLRNLKQKNLNWDLSGQETLDSATRKSWDPSAKQTLPRVAEMLMFHEAAGGKRFTKLESAPLSSLDLSGVLSKERCVLVGRLKQPVTEPTMLDSIEAGQGRAEKGVGQATEVEGQAVTPGGVRHTMLRLVLPIDVMPDYR